MDWARAIERNSEALERIVDSLFVMLGLVGAVTVARIPLRRHHAVLRLLRPAESALRRLVVIAARGLVVKVVPSRPMLARPKTVRAAVKGVQAAPSFRLYDPRKKFAELRTEPPARNLPRIHVFGGDPRVAALWAVHRPKAGPAPSPDGLVGGERLSRRLHALKAALDDLPRQARRLARWRVRRKTMPRPKFTSPLRPGRPPGYRRKPTHEVDEVLIECHGLACDAMRLDTS
jgi:hypothetical protein